MDISLVNFQVKNRIREIAIYPFTFGHFPCSMLINWSRNNNNNIFFNRKTKSCGGWTGLCSHHPARHANALVDPPCKLRPRQLIDLSKHIIFAHIKFSINPEIPISDHCTSEAVEVPPIRMMAWSVLMEDSKTFQTGEGVTRTRMIQRISRIS